MLRADGTLLRGPDYLLVLAADPSITFYDATGASYPVDPAQVAGIAIVGADRAIVAAFGQHPD